MSAPWPKGFQCPPTMRPHVQRVLDGEYALPPGYSLEGNIRVLDVGANVGAFAFWARRQWPDAEIWCYEPHPETYKTLESNVEHLPPREPRVDDKVSEYLAEVAVHGADWNSDGAYLKLYDGKHNCGEASLHQGPEQSDLRSFLVRSLDAERLPVCEVLKLDTEGSELDILRAYPFRRDTLAILLEWHSLKDRWRIGALLSETHECVRDDQWCVSPPRGIMAWVKA